MEIFRRESRTITVNGRTYSSVDEMPPDVRAQFEKAMALLADKNKNGIPDAFETPPDPNGIRGLLQDVATKSAATGKPRFQASWSTRSGGGGSGGITLSWPTLIALLATVAVIGGAIV